jgi:hypothetical protein
VTQEEFVAAIAASLNAAGIPFMMTGSHGSSHHGAPRATQDVDLVADPTGESLDQFLRLLGDRYYVSPDAAREALRSRSQFNVIDINDGWKADIIIRKDRPFSIEEFRRRQPLTLHGQQLSVASAEDVILSKLEWNRITPSERQLSDALNVAIVQWPRLDHAYLRKWASSLGVADRMEEVLTKAEQGQPPAT